MNFGEALNELKNGSIVTRTGWNGKGMFLWLKPATVIKEEWCKDPILRQICQDNGGEVEALGTICMKTADNKVLTGWLASQTDMLSEDWELYAIVPELTEKEMDFDYHAFNAASTHEVSRLRDIMGIGVSEEEKAATHEKITNTTDNLSANIQRDVYSVLQEADKQDKIIGLNTLKEKYMMEAKTDEEKIYVASQFEMFLDYARNL